MNLKSEADRIAAMRMSGKEMDRPRKQKMKELQELLLA